MDLPVSIMEMLNKAGVIKMRIESYQVFAQLLEGYVNEASTTMSLIAGQPGGKEVIQKLHKDMQLAHDIGYKQVDKISWSELKDSYRGAWVIIQGTKGTGAIRARNSSYEAVASTGGETRSVSDGRGGNIIDFLKGEIGKLNKFYVGKNTTAVPDKAVGVLGTIGIGVNRPMTILVPVRPLVSFPVNFELARMMTLLFVEVWTRGVWVHLS